MSKTNGRICGKQKALAEKNRQQKRNSYPSVYENGRVLKNASKRTKNQSLKRNCQYFVRSLAHFSFFQLFCPWPLKAIWNIGSDIGYIFFVRVCSAICFNVLVWKSIFRNDDCFWFFPNKETKKRNETKRGNDRHFLPFFRQLFCVPCRSTMLSCSTRFLFFFFSFHSNVNIAMLQFVASWGNGGLNAWNRWLVGWFVYLFVGLIFNANEPIRFVVKVQFGKRDFPPFSPRYDPNTKRQKREIKSVLKPKMFLIQKQTQCMGECWSSPLTEMKKGHDKAYEFHSLSVPYLLYVSMAMAACVALMFGGNGDGGICCNKQTLMMALIRYQKKCCCSMAATNIVTYAGGREGAEKKCNLPHAKVTVIQKYKRSTTTAYNNKTEKSPMLQCCCQMGLWKKLCRTRVEPNLGKQNYKTQLKCSINKCFIL